MPDVLPQGFTDPNEPWLRYSRAQVGDEPPLYYWLLGAVYSFLPDTDLTALLYVGRAFSVALYAVAIGLVYLTCCKVFPRSRFMTLVPAAFVAFLPMMGQMGAAVNSDVLALLAVSAVFFVWAHAFTDAKIGRHVPAVVASFTVALLAKKTTVFLLLVAPIGGIIWLLVSGLLSASLVKRAALVLICLAVVAAAGLALLPSRDAAGWQQWRLIEGGECGPTRVNGTARSGSAALRAGACSERHLTQVLSEATLDAAVGSNVVLSGWVRAEHTSARAMIYILETGGRSEMLLDLSEDWQRFQLSHRVEERPRYMVVRVAWMGSGSAILLDDLELTAGQDAGNRLVNGSAEEAKSALMMLLVRGLRLMRVPDRIAEQLFARESWQRSALAAHALAFRFAFESFWGLFGSLSVPLPRLWYRLLLLVCGMSVLSLLVSVLVKPKKVTPHQTGYLVLAATAVVLLFAQTFVPILGMRASDWLPQGRYLFPGLMPIALLGAWAWYWWLPQSWRQWATYLSLGAIVLFDLGCLWILVSHFSK